MLRISLDLGVNMKNVFNKKIKELTKSFLSARAMPWGAAIAVLLFGGFIILSVYKNPFISALVIGLITIIGVVYISILGYIVKKETFKLSDYAELPNYSYKTVSSEMTYDIADVTGKTAELTHKRKIQAENTMNSILEIGWGDGAAIKREDITVEPNEFHVGGPTRKGSNYYIFTRRHNRILL
jgi:hypothetical protein